MLDKIRDLDIAIGAATYRLRKAEDRLDCDSFNYWFSELVRLNRERSDLLDVKLGGV